jgi:hypothetical protein
MNLKTASTCARPPSGTSLCLGRLRAGACKRCVMIQPKPQYRCGILKHPSSIAKRALQQAKALLVRRSEITHFADHLHSGVVCIQCRQARGGIPLVAIAVRACMPVPGQRAGIFTSATRRMGVLVHNFFRPHRGVSGDHRSRLGPLGTNSVRTCPRRTRPAPIYSAHRRTIPNVRPLKSGLSC